MRVVADHSILGACIAPRSQTFVIGNHKLLLRLVVGDRSWEISSRDIANHRIDIPSLEVDDGYGISLPQGYVGFTVFRHGDAVRTGAKDSASDRNTEIDSAGHRIGTEIDDRQAIAIGVGHIEIGTGDCHAY